MQKQTSYHPLLPTINEVERGSAFMNSDHIPAFYEIPLTICGRQKLKILSLNLLVPNLCSGFSPFHEDEPAMCERAKRIISFLILAKSELGYDLLCLQENWLNKEQLTEIGQLLGEAWVVSGGNSETGLTTFVNSSKLEFIAEENSQRYLQKLSLKQGDIIFNLTNVHIPHENFPMSTEERVRTNLPEGQNSIVVGDFNSRVVPLDTSGQLIVNNVVSSSFREGKGQGCDWTDGAFYRFFYDNTAHQAQRNSVNKEGVLFHLPLLDTREIAQLPPFENNELTHFRPFLHIDDSYRHAKINGFLTVFELEKLLPGNGIMVRFCANALNQRAVAIKLSEELKELNSTLIEQYRKKGCAVEYTEAGTGPLVPVLILPFEQVRSFVEDCRGHFVWLFESRIGQEAILLPHTLPRRLQVCAHDMNQLLPDDGLHVEESRVLKQRIKKWVELDCIPTQLFAKVLLANYYLRFSEYSHSEISEVLRHTPHPEKMIRYTHFVAAIDLYRDVYDLLIKSLWIKTLSDREIILLVAELVTLGGSIDLVAKVFESQFVDLIACHHVALGNQFERKFLASYYQTAADILNSYSEVMRCQGILDCKQLPRSNLQNKQEIEGIAILRTRCERKNLQSAILSEVIDLSQLYNITPQADVLIFRKI